MGVNCDHARGTRKMCEFLSFWGVTTFHYRIETRDIYYRIEGVQTCWFFAAIEEFLIP